MAPSQTDLATFLLILLSAVWTDCPVHLQSGAQDTVAMRNKTLNINASLLSSFASFHSPSRVFLRVAFYSLENFHSFGGWAEAAVVSEPPELKRLALIPVSH